MSTTIVNIREDLSFDASDLNSARQNVQFVDIVAPYHLQKITIDTVEACLSLLPKEFQPEKIEIALEKFAVITTSALSIEFIPMSLVTNQRNPGRSYIQIGMLEIENDETAYQSILAHEVGQMLIEQVCLKANPNHPWNKSIYNGIADWITYHIAKTEFVGGENIWFKRKLGAYQSLEAIQKTKGVYLKEVSSGLKTLGLIPRYDAYQKWLDTQRTNWETEVHPYAEGSYLAWRLHQKSKKMSFKKLFKIIMEEAISGSQYNDIQSFVLRLNLDQ